jgi:hypothetical protein
MIPQFNYTSHNENELKLIVSKIQLMPICIIMAYPEHFKLIPFVYQSFMQEFTNPYIADINRRIILHQFASEICSSNLN